VGFDMFFKICLGWREKTGFFCCGKGAFVMWVEEIADDEHSDVGLKRKGRKVWSLILRG